MVTVEETLQTPTGPPKCPLLDHHPSSPARISFSSDLLDDSEYITICPDQEYCKETAKEPVKNTRNLDNFEFLSGSLTDMMTADELFRGGKVLPFWQTHHKLDKITLKSSPPQEERDDGDERRTSWFLDEDPSPRPPKCTVLWKELLRLRKQRASILSNSPSSNGRRKGEDSKEKMVSRVKRGLERTRSASIRIRPMVNIPRNIYTPGNKNTPLPPLFSLRRGRSLD